MEKPWPPKDIYRVGDLWLPAESATTAIIAMLRTRSIAGRLGEGLGYLERPPVHLGAVHLADGFGGFLLGPQLDKPEPLAVARVPVRDDGDRFHRAELRKRLFQRILRCGKGKISDVQFLAHKSSFKAVSRKRGHEHDSRDLFVCGRLTSLSQYHIPRGKTRSLRDGSRTLAIGTASLRAAVARFAASETAAPLRLPSRSARAAVGTAGEGVAAA